jgi:hypothetical protein
MNIQETKKAIEENPEYWQIPLMDFVDFFRHTKDISAATKPPSPPANDKIDAILASTVEYLCSEMKLPVPKWTKDIPSCHEPWFVSGVENLKAISIAESPVYFRIRKIFTLANFLDRA